MRRFTISVLLLLVLTACGQAASSTLELGAAAPYRAPSATPTPTLLPALTGVTLPTPTPLVYTVVLGDTLDGIAQRYGVPLEALLAANPTVQPTALTVGTELVIPTGETQSGEPTPTPALLPVTQAQCWPELAGGLWCFALLQNDYAETLEDLSAQFTLLDADGAELASQAAYGLLDILPAGKAMPLAIHFAAPQQADVRLRVQVLTSIRLLPGDTRYLPVTLENTLVSVQAEGRTAQVSGLATLSGEETANALWVLGIAYDAAGEVAGVRRWGSPSALAADAPVAFDFQVSSVGPAIERVDFLAEARP
jgi:murein DD-endopeptidase MepM/ murein hydrolase activator NlpD